MDSFMYNSTIISKYIKYLLSAEKIPKIPLVVDGQLMHAGRYYIYNVNLVLCTVSGYFDAEGIHVAKHLTISDALEITNSDNSVLKQLVDDYGQLYWTPANLTVTDGFVSTSVPAVYSVIDSDVTSVENFLDFTTYTSTTDYYDSTTHYHLREYLRWIRNCTSLDLMPLYNHYCGEVLSYEELQIGSALDVSRGQKFALVPIHFDTTYTVAVQSSLAVSIFPVIYDRKCGLIKDVQGNILTEKIDFETVSLGSSRFSDPIRVFVPSVATDEVAVPTVDPRDLSGWENNLFLVIQLYKGVDPVVTVVEGDHVTHDVPVVHPAPAIESISHNTLTSLLSGSLSLLDLNKSGGKPYATKLIEYICGNTIDSRETNSNNIHLVQEMLQTHREKQFCWSLPLQSELFLKYQQMFRDNMPEDILGYVDSDIEDALRKGVLISGK